MIIFVNIIRRKVQIRFMQSFIEKVSKDYALTLQQSEMLLSYMEPVEFQKGDFIVREGERNTNFYIIENGVWRSFRMNDGEEMTLWFAAEGECVFAIWGYTNDSVSGASIEIEADCKAYMISKARIEELCSTSLEMANLIRRIFEQHALLMENFLIFFADHVGAEQRYKAIMKKSPELLQQVSLKKLASYLYVTPQSLSRIRAGLKKRKA